MIKIIEIKNITDNMQVDLSYSPLIEIISISLLILGAGLVYKLRLLTEASQ